MISFGKIKFEGAEAEKVGACGRHVEDAFPGRFCYFYDPKKNQCRSMLFQPQSQDRKILALTSRQQQN